MTRFRRFQNQADASLRMKLLRSVAIPILLAIFHALPTPAAAAIEEGVALAILYDTSGSMSGPVKDDTGKMAPKYLIANRALIAIANRIQAFATNNASGGPRNIQAGLFQKAIGSVTSRSRRSSSDASSRIGRASCSTTSPAD